MNKLVNEAIREYLLKVTPRERELSDTLASMREYRERASGVQEIAPTYVVGLGGSETFDAAREFVRRVESRYPVKAAILFGSRARNTHRTDSDVDVAIILTGSRGELMKTALDMADIAFEVLLDTEVYIEPLPIWESEWNRPETHSNPRLLENIRRDGIAL